MSETLETATTPHANLDRRTFLKGSMGRHGCGRRGVAVGRLRPHRTRRQQPRHRRDG